MVHREYHRWYSPNLNRDMELVILGHAGARVLVFPTSRGRFYEWEDRGVARALVDYFNNGWLQFYCVDSIDSESWYCWWAQPGGRAYRHHQYFMYLMHEVIPLSWHKNQNPFLMTMGASFGAYHAMTLALKYPGVFKRVIGLSGFYDIHRFTGGYSDDYVYFNNPVAFVPNENDDVRLHLLRETDIILVTSEHDALKNESLKMSGVLWNKGIGNALRIWDGWQHDWPYWMNQLRVYLGGHD